MKDPAFAKLVVFVNSCVPLALLLYDVAVTEPGKLGPLGANPVEFCLHTTGQLALIFLLLSLVITPARKITGWNFLSHFRRMLGLFGFFYACVHLAIYFIFDRGMSLSRVWDDIQINQKPFILFGMLALLLLIPLAITSTNGMIKRLGAARWKNLHKLVYPAAILAVLHFWFFGKGVNKTKPMIAAVVLILLLGYRLLAGQFSFLRRKQKVGVPVK